MGLVEDNAENVSNAIQTSAESLKDSTPSLLEDGKTACNLDEIVIDSMNVMGYHNPMMKNLEDNQEALLIMEKWIRTQETTACEIAAMNDILPKDQTGKIWRNQLGIKSAMKNLKDCTVIDCIEEYGLIEILEDKS